MEAFVPIVKPVTSQLQSYLFFFAENISLSDSKGQDQTAQNMILIYVSAKGLKSQLEALPFPKRQNLQPSKLKEFTDDNFKFHEDGGKFSKRVESTVEKGEIARYEQFLLFPQCFQKTCFQGASKGVIVWEWVKC